jgi:MinD-like ATPase involved in chromosome partitioning or flagellar assembly
VITKFREFDALRLVVPVIATLLACSSALGGELGTLTSVARDFMNAAEAQAAILVSHPTPKDFAAATITYAVAKERYYTVLRSKMPILIDMCLKRMPATAEIKEFQAVFNQFGDEQEQRVAKATAEMLERLKNDEGIGPAEKEFERATQIERAFEKDFDGLDSA